jgi:UPF0755 protein
MPMYRGSWPPGGNRPGPTRPSGAYPPMPGQPAPAGPPGRFIPPGDAYGRGGPGAQTNGHFQPNNSPPFARNGSGPNPPYGPYRAPPGPPPFGARAPMPPPPGLGNNRNGHYANGHNAGGPPGNGHNGHHGNGHNGHPYALAPRGFSDLYAPNRPRGPGERRPYDPHGAPPYGAHGANGRPATGNGQYPPVTSPPPFAPETRKDRSSPPPPPHLSNGAASNGHDGPTAIRRAFTPVQDYLAGADVVAERPRAASHAANYRQQDTGANGHVMPPNPLPLGEDYSARALVELAQAMENSSEHSVHDRDVRMSDTSVASDEHDGSLGDDGESWNGDTITPERLENLLGRANLNEPLIADDDLMDKRPINPRSPRVALEPERVPQPMRRSRRARHPLVVAGNALFTLLVILAVVAGGALVFGKQRFEAAGPLANDKVVTIPKGLGIRDISELLVQEGVIEQPWIFMGGVFVLKARDELKAGEYQFTRHASLRDVIGTIVDGKVIQHQLTLAEGLTSEQIVQRILESDLLTGNIREIPREGSLLPETYRLTRGTSREQLIQRMQQTQRRLVQEIWEHRMPDSPLKTPEQLVTLASIVEKETGRPEERSRVAAVFINRLKQRMRLQSDPTIIYGLVGGKGSLGRPIMRSEIEQPTPYNTYVIDGLPPGPIANPGRAALEATANPARTKEIFFVADGTGGHAFAENLEQHNKNVARLRQIEQQSPWPAPQAPPAANSGAPPAPGQAARPRSAATKPAATQ